MKYHIRFTKRLHMLLPAAALVLIAAAFLILPVRKTYAAVLPADNGIYRISPAGNTNYVLDIMDGSRKMKAKVQLLNWKKKTRQKFQFEKQADGTYLIRNVKSKHVLTATGKKNGSPVYQYKETGKKAQKWSIRENADGTLSFINQKSNKALTLASSTPDRFVRIVISTDKEKKTQKFLLKKTKGSDKKAINYETVTYHRSGSGGSHASSEWYFSRNSSHKVPGGAQSEAWLKKYNAYYVAPKRDKKYIYFTFDCGYENGQTSKILDVLKKKKVKACFFVTAPYIQSNPELVRRMKKEGHLVGNHTKTHPALGPQSMDQIREELEYTANLMKTKTGYKMDKIMRPPMGNYSEYMLAAADKLGYTTIFWSIAYMDYEPSREPGTSYVINHFNANHHDRAITLTHAVSSSNANALGTVIKNLKKQGYHFGSLDFLIK
ncbi:MAG: polysaccharide deacetylase family protein [Eubacterium sp.]|nr:polysaccharide deacetylase family protein [Eubacterium sp.]